MFKTTLRCIKNTVWIPVQPKSLDAEYVLNRVVSSTSCCFKISNAFFKLCVTIIFFVAPSTLPKMQISNYRFNFKLQNFKLFQITESFQVTESIAQHFHCQLSCKVKTSLILIGGGDKRDLDVILLKCKYTILDQVYWRHFHNFQIAYKILIKARHSFGA